MDGISQHNADNNERKRKLCALSFQFAQMIAMGADKHQCNELAADAVAEMIIQLNGEEEKEEKLSWGILTRESLQQRPKL